MKKVRNNYYLLQQSQFDSDTILFNISPDYLNNIGFTQYYVVDANTTISGTEGPPNNATVFFIGCGRKDSKLIKMGTIVTPLVTAFTQENQHKHKPKRSYNFQKNNDYGVETWGIFNNYTETYKSTIQKTLEELGAFEVDTFEYGKLSAFTTGRCFNKIMNFICYLIIIRYA